MVKMCATYCINQKPPNFPVHKPMQKQKKHMNFNEEMAQTTNIQKTANKSLSALLTVNTPLLVQASSGKSYCLS